MKEFKGKRVVYGGVPYAPVGLFDIDGTLALSKRRRHLAAVNAVEVINELLGPFLGYGLKVPEVDVFWNQYRATGNIAWVLLGDRYDTKTQRGVLVARNVREEFDAAVALYSPEQLALDEISPEMREATSRILSVLKGYAVTFRQMPQDQLITHFQGLGLVNSGADESMFHPDDVFAVGSKDATSFQAKAAYIMWRFGDLIDAQRQFFVRPALMGDAISDMLVALHCGLFFVGFTETGEASRERFEAECDKVAAQRQVKRTNLPVALFDSICDPKFHTWLQSFVDSFNRKMARAKASHWSPPNAPGNRTS